MVDSSRIANIVGYELKPGQFSGATPNLPQRIVILGQPNAANEASITENEVKEYSILRNVGNRYGFGSPIYNMFKLLRPITGTGVGGIPTVVIPQKAANSATAKKLNVEPTGTANSNAEHTLVIAGRRRVSGARYSFVVESGDGPANIAQKMVDTVNNALAAPVTGTVDTTETTTESLLAETKWSGLDADELTIEVDTNDNPAGISYSVTEISSGAGTPAIQGALDKFEEWNTIIVNPYGTSVHTTLELNNGKPSEQGGSGRYSPTIFKPFVALFGFTDTTDSLDFSSQKEEVTNVLCPAPGSKNFKGEVAAAYARLLANQAQDNPHIDIQGQRVPGITVGDGIGDFADYNFRDRVVKKGYSTATVTAGNYEVQDFVTTYHKEGEVPLQFNHVRNLIIDWNIRYRYMLVEKAQVLGKAIAADSDFVDVNNVIKPKQWRSALFDFADQLGADGLIADVDFMKANINVEIDDTNPDRLNTDIKYKRTGFTRILSTVSSAGFNLG